MKQEYMDDCPEYIKDYLLNLRLIKDRADRTEEAYYLDIRTFLRYLKLKHKDVDSDTPYSKITVRDVPFSYIENFTLYDAYEFMNYLKETRCNSTATRARKTSAIKQLYSYLHNKAKMLEVNPLEDLELPRVKNKLPKFLSLEQAVDLLKNIDSRHKTRDYCIICLFLNCGMRLSELVGLNIVDYNKENRTLRLFGKGSKERIVYLNDACISAIEGYLKDRPTNSKDPDAMFLSQQLKRIDKRRVQFIVEEMLKKAGLSNLGVSTHKLRHTAATLMYQHGGVDPLILKEILGHKSIATTEIYTHLSNENLKKAAEASPLADKIPDKK